MATICHRGQYTRIKSDYWRSSYTVQVRKWSFLPFWKDLYETRNYGQALNTFNVREKQ